MKNKKPRIYVLINLYIYKLCDFKKLKFLFLNNLLYFFNCIPNKNNIYFYKLVLISF